MVRVDLQVQKLPAMVAVMVAELAGLVQVAVGLADIAVMAVYQVALLLPELVEAAVVVGDKPLLTELDQEEVV